MKSIHSTLFLAATCCVLGSSIASAQTFLDNYDDQTPESGTAPTGYYDFGGIESIGVTSTESVSAPNSAFVTVDFNGSTFGAGLSHPMSTAIDLEGDTLSVDLASTANLSNNSGIFAFTVVDGSGNTARTPTSELFNPGTSFTSFSEAASDLVPDGGSSTINLADITEVGYDFFDRGEDVSTTFNIDNFEATPSVSVPEPRASILILLFGILVGVLSLRRKYRLAF